MREKGIGRQFLWAIYYRIRESSTVEIQQATKHKFSVEGNPGWSIHKKVCPLTFLVTIKLNSCLKLAQNSACHYCVLWLRCSQPLSLSRISRASCGPCDVLPMFPTLLCQGFKKSVLILWPIPTEDFLALQLETPWPRINKLTSCCIEHCA